MRYMCCEKPKCISLVSSLLGAIVLKSMKLKSMKRSLAKSVWWGELWRWHLLWTCLLCMQTGGGQMWVADMMMMTLDQFL